MMLRKIGIIIAMSIASAGAAPLGVHLYEAVRALRDCNSDLLDYELKTNNFAADELRDLLVRAELVVAEKSKMERSLSDVFVTGLGACVAAYLCWSGLLHLDREKSAIRLTRGLEARINSLGADMQEADGKIKSLGEHIAKAAPQLAGLRSERDAKQREKAEHDKNGALLEAQARGLLAQTENPDGNEMNLWPQFQTAYRVCQADCDAADRKYTKKFSKWCSGPLPLSLIEQVEEEKAENKKERARKQRDEKRAELDEWTRLYDTYRAHHVQRELISAEIRNLEGKIRLAKLGYPEPYVVRIDRRLVKNQRKTLEAESIKEKATLSDPEQLKDYIYKHRWGIGRISLAFIGSALVGYYITYSLWRFPHDVLQGAKENVALLRDACRKKMQKDIHESVDLREEEV